MTAGGVKISLNLHMLFLHCFRIIIMLNNSMHNILYSLLSFSHTLSDEGTSMSLDPNGSEGFPKPIGPGPSEIQEAKSSKVVDLWGPKSKPTEHGVTLELSQRWLGLPLIQCI